MTVETRTLLEQVLKLPMDQRSALVDAVGRSLDAEPADSELSPEWLAEIARRSADLDAGRTQPIPWTGYSTAIPESVRTIKIKKLPKISPDFARLSRYPLRRPSAEAKRFRSC